MEKQPVRKDRKEKIQPINFKSQIVCLRPGGNDTALILNSITDTFAKKVINDSVMEIYPNIEQVGFVSLSTNEAELSMAGGEFCGNATRSTASLILADKPGSLKIKVSGVNNPLDAGITTDNEAYAQMPIYSDPSMIQKDPQSETGWIVKMEGITHYVDFNTSQIEGLNEDDIKRFSLAKIKEKGLDKSPASGVIFVKILENGNFEIVPIVYVKDINTLFLETACGSGTCAFGEVMAVKNNQSIIKLPVIQPSGEIIKISIDYKDDEFKYAQIEGKVSVLSKGIIKTDKENSFYVIEKLTRESLAETLTQNNLIKLYQKIFSQPPYEEIFSIKEVLNYFEDYLNKGTVLIARNELGIIGFSAVLPIANEPSILSLLNKSGISNNYQYIAELGVNENMRRKGIGQSLIEELMLTLKENTEVLLRTTISNKAAIELYEKIGFRKIKEIIQKIKKIRVGGNDLEDTRIFMIKSL